MQNIQPLQIKRWKIILPALIGLAAVAYMFFWETANSPLQNFDPTWQTAIYLLLAFIFMFGRDLGYIIRIRLLARGDLTWRQAFRVIMLWEFASAITPSTIGGTSVAVVFVHKEGLSVGKSATMVMLTAFFDELFFALCFPLVIWFVGFSRLFAFDGASTMMYLILAGYIIKLALTITLAYGLFINPKGLKWLIVKIFSLPFLKRWQASAEKSGDDIILSSDEIKHYKPLFWFRAFSATVLSWSSRFLVANAIFMAFFAVSDHLLVFARQLAMWVPMIIAPTPGGSGFAEYIFSNFLGDIISVSPETLGATVVMIALMWRGVTYYPYLVIGMFIIPRWVARSFKVPKKLQDKSPLAK